MAVQVYGKTRTHKDTQKFPQTCLQNNGVTNIYTNSSDLPSVTEQMNKRKRACKHLTEQIT